MGIIRSIDYIPFKPTTGTSAMSIDAPNQPTATQLINDAWFGARCSKHWTIRAQPLTQKTSKPIFPTVARRHGKSS